MKEKEIERLTNEKKKLEAEVTRGEKMLSNQGFISKAPESNMAGTANTLIFPDLNPGNIGYK